MESEGMRDTGAPGPAWDNSSAREDWSRSDKRLSPGPHDQVDDGGIYRMLRAMPRRQPLANDLDAPRIVDGHRWHMEIYCCQPHLPTRSSASWQARVNARSKGKARWAKTPAVAQAARGLKISHMHPVRSCRGNGWG